MSNKKKSIEPSCSSLETQIITGFKLTDCSSIAQAEHIVNRISAVLLAEAQSLYKTLLEREIEYIVDDVALGVRPRGELAIYDEAVNILNNRILSAISRRVNTEYNFRVSLYLLTHNSNVYMNVKH